ncbi:MULTISPECIES: DUF6099 family protein [Streptomyces]|uniref:Uncharacterized protein n=1 Tax=Streptomyces lycii TaxID=2654337 RepID=A0ABQ7FKK6_9ACTN|nr:MULTISPECIES: DUF6099 family protein [Streptomyces]KAF4409128.1 hypothetical protein GCU69_10595 [Streptomyces lycii]PGH48080.1 hypothetical protein CRI70_24935 [Streptomyces sp. Ru87]
MDAARLIEDTRHGLARAGCPREIVAEAWQAQALAVAVGSHLLLYGPQELRAEARGLTEAGGRTWGAPDPMRRFMGARAARLSDVSEPRRALIALGMLLGEVGIALVAVASAAEVEGFYWQCIEVIDAVDESGDRVRGLLRQLEERELS